MDDHPETEVEELWFTEAQHRLDELHNGKVEGIDSADAFRMVRKNLADNTCGG